MGRNRAASTLSVRIPLSEGDWIEVKEELSNGDQKKVESAGLRVKIDEATGKVIQYVDWEQHDIERALIYLTDWSLRGEDDKPIPLGKDGLRAIDPETFAEINTAVVAHAIGMAAAKKSRRDAMKKAAETQNPIPEPLPSDSGTSDAPTSQS